MAGVGTRVLLTFAAAFSIVFEGPDYAGAGESIGVSGLPQGTFQALTATKLDCTRHRTTDDFLLFSGEVRSATNAEH